MTVSVNVTKFENEKLSCTTDHYGNRCVVAVEVPKGTRSVTFTVESVTGALGYEPADNHDSNGNSDGTDVTVFKP